MTIPSAVGREVGHGIPVTILGKNPGCPSHSIRCLHDRTGSIGYSHEQVIAVPVLAVMDVYPISRCGQSNLLPVVAIRGKPGEDARTNGHDNCGWPRLDGEADLAGSVKAIGKVYT